ncbi:thioredoxin family protein [Croceivirga thetidis]|uniref:Thioredoxin family protein n=1 Tax=Croceivirga thetidis TaxID=2721623 RepID=A0ABX1GTX3_9FLAO|nr:thioredoxin family protein [Croceivirga thetidis]NKI33407.1 thioredoxin family protein [Croceivirga thetidis]
MNRIKSIVLIAIFTLASAFTTQPVAGYQIGDKAADFNLKNIDGKMVSLSDFEDAKGFLVIFTCNTCPYAVKYEDRIIALDEKYKNKGVPVVAIMPNDTSIKPGDSFDNMKKRAEEKGFTFPYLIDEKQEVFPEYGATRTPHVYLLQKTNEGNFVRYIGAIDDNYQDEAQVEIKFVENAVDAMLAGEPIQVTTTKAIGCSIKV